MRWRVEESEAGRESCEAIGGLYGARMEMDGREKFWVVKTLGAFSR